MIRLRTPRRFVAWLALAAIWLVVLAPVVSQTLLAAELSGIESGWCGTNPPHDPTAPSPHAELCGYCDLLGHSPVLLAVARLSVPLPDAPLPPPIRRLTLHAPRQPLRIAAPRGPPSFVNDQVC